ncbi:MAG: BMP family ABC transporter substrate-binding protein [Oscillospiraceae bacterium]|nr:BMP family ABC transporter substrate-binding protein [Oscillospiraceae bacterium]
MKKILALVMAMVLVLGLVACGETGAAGSNEEGLSAQTLKVGAIYINSKNDTAGYTFAHHSGITAAMKELGMDTEKQLFIVDEVPEKKDDVLAAVDTLVGNGVNIIFGISFGYIDAMEEAAAEYPNVIFSHGTGYKSNETNFNNYFGRAYQARYLAGIAAGLKSLELGNNNVGYVAAHTTDYAETASGINGFALGVQAANPNAKIYVKNLNNWADEVNEKAYAEELINSYNCGVISQHCDSAQPQIAAQTAGVFGCGYNSDMTPDAPKAHLTAAIWNWNVYYRTAMEAAIKAGTADKFVATMGTSAYYGGLKEGFVDVSPLSENCAENTDKAIKAVKELIISGEWDVFTGVKLEIAADGTVTQKDAALESNGFQHKDGDFKVPMENVEVVAAGGASVEDGVITGTMNYLVAGVEEV